MVGGCSPNKGSGMLMKTCVSNKMIIMIYISSIFFGGLEIGRTTRREERDQFCEIFIIRA